MLWGNLGFAKGCAFDYGGSAVLIQPLERTNLVARGTLAINSQHSVFAELTGSRAVATKQFEPYQITTIGGIAAAQYPVDGPYYQNLSAYIPTFDPTKKIAYRWRCTTCGGRTIETTTDAYRLLLGAEGVVFGNWDYKLGASTAGSQAESLLGQGYLFTDSMVAALGSGKVNPWLAPGQSQTAEALALIDGASARGTRLFDGQAKLLQLDGTISGELIKLPAGPLAVAAGFDVRQESYRFSDGSVATRPVYQAPFDAEFPKVKRDVVAVFAEMAVPITKSLEATLALRNDHYSDFGDTTNPKVSLKWTPIEQVLLRGSYNTGFRAPSFFQLFGATGESQIPGNIADPQLCPLGNVAGADL